MPYYRRPATPEGEIRVRTPRPGEIVGIVTELHGGARMKVQCADGKERMARVPGKIKRFIWVRQGDVVLIVPWAVEPNTKADIVYRYTSMQVDQLTRRGLLQLPQF